jgi:hypothetical protein
MNSASATTITVNTALFAAGDSVQIQNINTGVVTITAGTATVTTSGSLALSQWEGGFLYFTSASASIFFDYTQTGAVSPLTTKGDIWGYSTLDARIPIGTNDQVLTADSTQALGLKWATPAAGGVTLISTTTLTGASVTLSSIPTTYKNLSLLIKSAYSSNQDFLSLRLNGDSGSTSYYNNVGNLPYTTTESNPGGVAYLPIIYTYNTSSAAFLSFARIQIPQYTDTSEGQFVTAVGYGGGTQKGFNADGVYRNRTAAITSITLLQNGGTFTSGTVYLYGEK